jgi:hypothetical protein
MRSVGAVVPQHPVWIRYCQAANLVLLVHSRESEFVCHVPLKCVHVHDYTVTTQKTAMNMYGCKLFIR